MSDEWHYSHKNDGGYDVNAYGYDKNGVFRGSAPFKSNNSNEQFFKKKGKSKAAGGIGGILLIIFIIVVIIFLRYNWVSVFSIIGILLICTIFCFIAKRKLKKSIIARSIAIIITIGIIITVIYLGPVQNDGNFERWRNKSFSTTIK